MKILIKIADNLEGKYLLSLKKVIDSIKKDDKLKNVHIEIKGYEFQRNELLLIKRKRNDFVYLKAEEDSDENVDSIIYIPGSSINLMGNYLWYGTDTEKMLIMVASSFLYKNLIEGKLEFGAYILLLYSQFLTRLAVDLDEPHRKSRNCLNDHCTYQVELLNVFENEKNVLCDECFNNLIIKNKRYYIIAHNIINNIRRFSYLKKEGPKKIIPKVKIPRKEIPKKEEPKKEEPKKEIPKKLKIKSEFRDEKGCWYEFEIYMAKKCANIANLYKKLNDILIDTNSEIVGYSLYEVGGGWKGDINLKKASEKDWEKLRSLQKKYGKNDFKDIIKPLIDANGNRCTVFDETSIVLRIVADTKKEIKNLDPKRFKILGEILDVCQDITKIEKSIFVTIKKLEKRCSIVEIQD